MIDKDRIMQYLDYKIQESNNDEVISELMEVLHVIRSGICDIAKPQFKSKISDNYNITKKDCDVKIVKEVLNLNGKDLNSIDKLKV